MPIFLKVEQCSGFNTRIYSDLICKNYFDLIYNMFSNNNNHTLNPNICFPFPLVDIIFLNSDYETNTCRGGHADAEVLTTISGPILATSISTVGSPKLQGKIQRSAVNGHLSIASILVNAFELHGFPRGHHAINHAGKLGLTFSQVNIISKRLTLLISSLALLPGSDSHVSTNNDGDAVVMIILEDEEYVDERLIVLIIAILRVGATYMVVSREQVTSDQKFWQQLVSLIEPILVVTMCDPVDLSTAVKNDLNLLGREHFDDYQTDDDMDDSGGQLPLHHPMIKSLYESETGSTTEVNPFQASTSLVKKIRSSIIMKPSTYLKSPTVSCKVLWDLAMELKIVNEKDLMVPPFRSDVGLGSRTAFIFHCDCTAPHTGVVQQWCKIGHKEIRNRISWERIECPIKSTERLCLTFPLADPRSLVQIFNCFIHGKMLLIGEPGEFESGPFLLRKLGSDVFKNVQRIELTPDRLQDLLDCAVQPNQEYYLKRIKVWLISTSSSSSLTVALAKQFFLKLNSIDVQLIITYGSPETMYCFSWNMFSSLKELNKCMHLDKDGDRKLFLGTAAINTTVLVIDSRKSTICPAGHRGEICVLGSMIPVSGYCGSTILGKSISIFQTGDMGRFVQDKGGNLQLIVESSMEGEDKKRKFMVEGKLINLDDLGKTMKQSCVYVREAFAFICQRGRDIPEIILAVALKDQTKFDCVQEVVSTKLAGLAGPLALKCFPVMPPIIPRLMSVTSSSSQGSISAGGGGGGPVDVKSVRAAYFKHLGRSNPRDWYTLFPAKGPGGRTKNPGEEQIEKGIQIICKAVAFSLGLSLEEVISNFDNSFWDMGGTPINAILTVKSCLCQGKRLSEQI